MKKNYTETFIALSVAFLTATTGITAAHATMNPYSAMPASNVKSYDDPSSSEGVKETSKQSAITADPKANISFQRIAIAAPKPGPEKLEQMRLAEEKRVKDEADRIAKEEAEKKAKAEAEAARIAKEKADAEAATKAKKYAEDKALAEKKAAEEKTATEITSTDDFTLPSGLPAVSSSGLTKVGTTPASPTTVAEPKANLASNPNAYQRYAGEELARRGMGSASELGCLVTLWNRESGWNPNAANPSSSARGIPQKMMDVHHGAGWKTDPAALQYLSDPEVQINWGIDYIQGRYGSPCGAISFWNSNHWY